MCSKTEIVKTAGPVSVAELGCLVNEADTSKKQFYTAEWQDLTLSTRPEEGCTLGEVNDFRKESYKRQHQVQFVVQRSPYNIMKIGHLGEKMTEYKLPHRNVLPVPIFKPVNLATKPERAATPEELQRMMEFEWALNSGADGSCQDKRALSEIRKELPPVTQPTKLEFTKPEQSRSFSRSMSQDAQRG
ncbi:telethonin [Latimeria chalumnae]|uniref:Telethonin n=1 Tax=Latimeria chalumnae TaxID=7897 RepID=H3B7H2_LATCH|nr:PREDICTED: telethonin-like [Latimeria chalumnae]|eukprot:XP_005994092.1 PREDICTED: telethonin-like [Latimeria chalumnae]